MQIAICEDDNEYRRIISDYTNDYFVLHHMQCNIDEFFNGTDLLNSDAVYDILLLDIELGDSNGIDIAKEIRKKNENTVILIVTSYHQYLDDAMDLNVARYIDKPVVQSRFFSALDKALSIINESIITLHMKDNEILRLKVSDIIFAEAKLKSVFVCTGKQSYRIKETMKQLRSILTASCFATPHNSYIVNLNYIKDFKRDEIALCEPYSKIHISVSTRKQADFKRRFLDFIGEDLENA